MKKKNDIITEWLDKYGTKEIEEQVKKEIEDGIKSPLSDVSNYAFDPNKECYCSLCERHYKNYERFKIHMRKHYEF